VLKRVSRIEAKRNDTSLSADLNHAPEDSAGESAGNKVVELEEPAEDSVDEKAVTGIDPPAESSTTDVEPSELRDQMIKAYRRGDKGTGDSAFARLESLEQDPTEQHRDRLRRSAAAFIGGVDENALDELRAEAVDSKDPGLAWRLIGACLDAIQKPIDAAAAYATSIERSTSPKEKAAVARLRAGSLTKAGEVASAISELGKRLAEEDDEDALEELWQGLAEAYEKADETLSRALALHEVAKLAGNDSRKWFRAGYAYSLTNRDALALMVIHCYETALRFEPDHAASLNNLGVALLQADLKVQGIKRYKLAATAGSTLAMANMAQSYLSVGFAEEAEKLLEEASSLPFPDEKVARVNAELASTRKEQMKRVEKINDEANLVAQFMGKYGSARLKSFPGLPSDLVVEGKEVDLQVEGTSITATWKEGNFRSHRRFTGTIRGATIAGSFEKEAFSMQESISWEPDGTAYGVISSTGDIVETVKLREDRTAEFLNFTQAK